MEKISIHCDESSQNKHRYMVLGGVCFKESDRKDIQSLITKFRFECGMHAELKWTKVSRAKISEYKLLIDQFFALNNNGLIAFHCLIIDTSLIDHARFNNNDNELGFYKFYYQLFLHSFGRRYGAKSIFHAYLDRRETGYSLNTLREVLNHGCRGRYNFDHSPFRLVEYKNSKKDDMIQITDLLIGAIGASKNGHHLLPNASLAKAELASYIRKSASLSDDIANTRHAQKNFSVWNFKLR